MHNTREGWLLEAAELIRERVFNTPDADFVVPEFRVSVGWPKGKRSDTSVIGECFNTLNFEDGIPQVYISPVLKDRLEVLRCLVHEMIHVLDDCQSGHRGHFAYVFKRVGMTGKRTQTEAGEDLRLVLANIADAVGKYPHGRPHRKLNNASQKKQTSRMLKVVCADPVCGYVVRAARSNLDRGLPTCFCGTEMMEA